MPPSSREHRGASAPPPAGRTRGDAERPAQPSSVPADPRKQPGRVEPPTPVCLAAFARCRIRPFALSADAFRVLHGRSCFLVALYTGVPPAESAMGCLLAGGKLNREAGCAMYGLGMRRHHIASTHRWPYVHRTCPTEVSPPYPRIILEDNPALPRAAPVLHPTRRSRGGTRALKRQAGCLGTDLDASASRAQTSMDSFFASMGRTCGAMSRQPSWCL